MFATFLQDEETPNRVHFDLAQRMIHLFQQDFFPIEDIDSVAQRFANLIAC